MVKLQTNFGVIALELDTGRAPQTVKNFLDYVQAGFYSNTVLHRVIDDFMIQGGGFEPGMRQKPIRDSIKNEAANGLKNERYTIAMARTSEPHSASSQCFINGEETVVLDVDEKLARRRMRFGSPGHGDRVALVLEAVVGFVLDGSPGRLLSHSRFEPAALDHEAVDDAVKHGVGVKPRFDVGEEVLDCFRRALGVQVERNDAEVRVQPYHGVSLTWPGSASPTRSPRASAGRFRVARRSRSAPWRSALRYPSPRPPARTPRIRSPGGTSRDSRGSRCP